MKVITNQINEIHITHLQKTTIANLTKMEAVTQEPKLYWCNGYIFTAIQYDTNESFIQITKGNWYIESLTYCKSPKIQQSKYNGFSIEVIDYTGDPPFEKLFDHISEAEK